MKDIHSHILMGIDDGASDLNSSIEILKQRQMLGITDIMLTPHYIKNSKYSVNNKQKLEIFEDLKNKLKENNININLYLGNEIYIDEDIISLIKNEEVRTLNNTRYVLIELPFINKLPNLKEIIFELIRNNYIPIIAHPERYKYVQDKEIDLQELIDMGVLFQGNYLSLFNKYGSSAKKTLKKLLKNNMIHFLASDIHKLDDDKNIKKLNKKILKIVKDEKIIFDLLDGNFTKVINNKEISI